MGGALLRPFRAWVSDAGPVPQGVAWAILSQPFRLKSGEPVTSKCKKPRGSNPGLALSFYLPTAYSLLLLLFLGATAIWIGSIQWLVVGVVI